MKVAIASVMVCLCLVGSVFAKPRIWTDKKGNTIEAEFLTLMGSKVVLKSADGKTLKVPVKGLCDADRKFLAASIPPKLKIDVDLDKDRNTESSYVSEYGSYGSETKSERVSAKVTIKKTNKEESSRKFTAYIYLFSEAISDKSLKVMDISEADFSFTAKKKITEFNSDTIQVKFSDSSYAGKSGSRFGGYLVIVVDDNDRIIASEASKSGFESHAATIRTLKENDRMTNKFSKLK